MWFCIVSGSNNDITRMEEIKERALLYKGVKHYFLVKFPKDQVLLKRICFDLFENDDIAFLNIPKNL